MKEKKRERKERKKIRMSALRGCNSVGACLVCSKPWVRALHKAGCGVAHQ